MALSARVRQLLERVLAAGGRVLPRPDPVHKLPSIRQGTSRRGRWLATLRGWVQLASFLLFLVLLLQTEVATFQRGSNLAGDLPYPTSLYLQADPLLGVATSLATGSLYDGLIWGLAALLLTLLLGRAFCGWLCPFGAVQHAVEWLGRGWRRATKVIAGNRYAPGQRLKYYLLAALLVISVSGSMLVGLFDPISLLTRSLSLSILPALDEAARAGIRSLQQTELGPLQTLAAAGELIRPHLLPARPTHAHDAWVFGLVFLGLVGVVLWFPRFWCRRLCPLGALLGVCSRPALLGLAKDESRCTSCNRCLVACQGACDPQGGAPWHAAECHLCFNCEAACPEAALAFTFLPSRATTRLDADLTRRALVGSLAAGAVTLPLLRSSAGFAGPGGVAADPSLIRPPGALPEGDFLARCVKCGECMKVCPTHALHPTLLQAGLEGIWTPRLVPRIGYCEPTCTLCGEVCPTGAIRHLTEAEKTGHDGQPPVRLGTAFYDLGRCLPWAMHTPCIVCEEWCPTTPKAIWLEEVTVDDRDGKPIRLQRPHVDPRRCTGCGACEFACPIKDQAAIRVTSAGEVRHPHNRFLLSG